MESVIIVAPCPYEAELEARLQRSWPAMQKGSHEWRLAIEDGGTRVYVYRLESVSHEPEERARIEAVIPTPIFYCVDFSDIALCRRVLFAIADDPRILVDNDHGVLLPGHEFVGLIRFRPTWDWRLDRVIPRDRQP